MEGMDRGFAGASEYEEDGVKKLLEEFGARVIEVEVTTRFDSGSPIPVKRLRARIAGPDGIGKAETYEFRHFEGRFTSKGY